MVTTISGGLIILQMVQTDTHLFWNLPSPWGELLVQGFVEDLQSWQDAGNFTVSQQSMVKSALNIAVCMFCWLINIPV